MVKAKNKIPRKPAFIQPLLKSKDIKYEEVLEARLDLLCVELGVPINSSNKYHDLCIILLVEVIGLRGFEVVERATRYGGSAPVVWTLKRHASLFRLVEALRAKPNMKVAINRARLKFSEELSDPDLSENTVRAEYYRARKFFKSAPILPSLMLVLNESSSDGRPGSNLSDFLKNGALHYTASGTQAIAPTHIGKFKRYMQKNKKEDKREL